MNETLSGPILNTTGKILGSAVVAGYPQKTVLCLRDAADGDDMRVLVPECSYMKRNMLRLWKCAVGSLGIALIVGWIVPTTDWVGRAGGSALLAGVLFYWAFYWNTTLLRSYVSISRTKIEITWRSHCIVVVDAMCGERLRLRLSKNGKKWYATKNCRNSWWIRYFIPVEAFPYLPEQLSQYAPWCMPGGAEH
jgi:hypothetical protein